MAKNITYPQVFARNITKSFGKKVHALKGVSIAVFPGTVVAILGPNGAGKTTFVRILTTLLQPTSGMARVEGFDVVKNAAAVRERIGLAGQNAAVDENLTGSENLDMVARLYHMTKAASKVRAAELLARFELVDAGDRVVKTYSGGMRRRLDLAMSLVNKPKILFLDEPTTGLDPASRLVLWKVLEGLVAEGTTILLTTQYLEEADRLADTIVVIDKGMIIAQGTSESLKAELGDDVLEIEVEDAATAQAAIQALGDLGTHEADFDPGTNKVTVPISGKAGAVVEAVRRLDQSGIKMKDIAVRQPTLDDVFLQLTGHAAEENNGAKK